MEEYYKEVNKILLYILILNIIVSFIKIGYGYYSNILSISSSGVDSFFDGINNIIGIIAIIIASKPSDKEHQYGYSKFETLASVIIGLMLLFVSYEVITAAIDRFYGLGLPNVSIESFIIMIITLVINLIISRYEYNKGKELKSNILISDSQHTKADLYATIVIILGLVFIELGYPIIDSVLSLFIALVIIKTGLTILYKNLSIFLDRRVISPDEIVNLLMSVDGVENVHNVRNRGTPSNIYMDMHIVVDSDMPMKKAHEISEICKESIMENYPEIKDVLIHTESEEGLLDEVVYK